MISEKTLREFYLIAFGPRPEPELDGAGRDCFEFLMREYRQEYKEARMNIIGR